MYMSTVELLNLVIVRRVLLPFSKLGDDDLTRRHSDDTLQSLSREVDRFDPDLAPIRLPKLCQWQVSHIGVFEILADGYAEMRQRARVLKTERSWQDEQMRRDVPEPNGRVGMERDEDSIALHLGDFDIWRAVRLKVRHGHTPVQGDTGTRFLARCIDRPADEPLERRCRQRVDFAAKYRQVTGPQSRWKTVSPSGPALPDGGEGHEGVGRGHSKTR
jgi:hypothetical protein